MVQTWTNNDGLTLYYGVDKARVEPVGEFADKGNPTRCTEIRYTYSDMPAVASNSVVISDKYSFPIGAKFSKVAIQTWVDMDSTSDDMTLNVGWVDLDGSSNADVDAFVVAATQTELNAGGENLSGWVGVAVDGSPLTTAKYLTWEVDAHAASAGEGVIRIFWTT